MEELEYGLDHDDNCSLTNLNKMTIKYTKSLSILNVNLRSLKGNWTKLITFLSQLKHKPTLIIITESWLDDNISHLFHIQDYKMLCQNRNSLGGGVAVYYRNSINAKVLQKYTGLFDTHESLCLSINLPNMKNIKILAIYRPPNKNVNEFINYLTKINYKSFEKCIIAGDLNINLLVTTNQSERLRHFLTSHNFYQLIKYSTRYSYDVSSSLLDHTWSNLGIKSESFVIEPPLSDHLPTLTFFSTNTTYPDKELKFRDFSARNKTKFFDNLDAEFSLFLNRYGHITDIDNRALELTIWLTYPCQKYFPIRFKNVSHKCYCKIY